MVCFGNPSKCKINLCGSNKSNKKEFDLSRICGRAQFAIGRPRRQQNDAPDPLESPARMTRSNFSELGRILAAQEFFRLQARPVVRKRVRLVLFLLGLLLFFIEGAGIGGSGPVAGRSSFSARLDAPAGLPDQVESRTAVSGRTRSLRTRRGRPFRARRSNRICTGAIIRNCSKAPRIFFFLFMAASRSIIFRNAPSRKENNGLFSRWPRENSKR